MMGLKEIAVQRVRRALQRVSNLLCAESDRLEGHLGACFDSLRSRRFNTADEIDYTIQTDRRGSTPLERDLPATRLNARGKKGQQASPKPAERLS